VPLNFQLLAAALHADLTRVATVVIDNPPEQGLGSTAPMARAIGTTSHVSPRWHHPGARSAARRRLRHRRQCHGLAHHELRGARRGHWGHHPDGSLKPLVPFAISA
jgi:hypothetical protein